MKLRNWLITSYIIVILIPLVIALGLFKGIERYNSSGEIKDYFQSMLTMTKYQDRLVEPSLYLNHNNKLNLIDKEDSNKIQIQLYSKNGMLLTDTTNSPSGYDLQAENLYENLYKLQEGYKAYSIKEPVFVKGEIIGFYEITLARVKLLKGINNLTMQASVVFVLLILALILIIIALVNKKLNRPVKKLRQAMSSFAEGENVEEIDYRKKDEIGELIAHFHNMKKELEVRREELLKAQREKEYMISALSHDLKTPLTVIRANAEALRLNEGPSLEEKMEATSIIVSKSDYMKNMIEDLLEFTSLSSDYNMNLKEVEGEEFFEMLLSGYDSLCKEKDIEIQVQVGVLGCYEVDVKQMIRLMDNLMSNAIRHTKIRGKICIGAFSEETELPSWVLDIEKLQEVKQTGVLLIVYNEGQEIPQLELEKVFKPFYQISNARSKGTRESVGLGLSIVRLISEKHKGKLYLYSKKHKGTQIACWLKRM